MPIRRSRQRIWQSLRVRLDLTEEDPEDMPTGTVKWFNTTKGFGFIAPDDGGKDVFVHITAVQAAGLQGLNEGQRVSYETVEDRKGVKADKLVPSD